LQGGKQQGSDALIFFSGSDSFLGDVLDPDVVATVEEYVSYGVRNLSSVNDARLQLFRKSTFPKVVCLQEGIRPTEKVQSIRSLLLTTLTTVLQQKLLRTNFVAYVWKHAIESRPLAFGPDGHGWEIDDRRLKIVWFTGPNAPSDIAIEESDLEDQTDDESDADEFSSQEVRRRRRKKMI